MTPDARDERLADALDDLLARRRRGEVVGCEAYRDRLGDDTPALEGALRAAEVLEAAAEGLGDGPDGAAPPRYRLGRELGRGGAGIVFEAFDAELARKVAWKTVRSDVRLDAAALERFRREARAAASLRHPHVVAIHDAGETDGRPWYAMELVGGGTLAERLRARAQPPLPALLRGLAGIADGLAALHAAGLVHRDVKPSNVLVRDDGSFALADFGLARALEGDGLTQTGQVLGSPPYMSPEQALGRHDAVDARTDVYALGASAFHAVTGAPPFTGDDPGDVLRRVREERPPRASSRVPGLPRGLDAVLARALAKRPEDRTPTAAALRDDLLALAEGRTPPSLRARRTRILAGVAVALCAVGVALGLPSRTPRHAARIETLPASDLEIDGAAVGRTPFVAELAPGPHRVLARREGFAAATWTIDVPLPAAAPAPFVLEPLPEAAAAGELALVEAALGHALGPWPEPPPEAPAPPGTLHLVLPRGTVAPSELARLRIERTPPAESRPTPAVRGEVTFRRGDAVIARFPVELRAFPADVEVPPAALAAIHLHDDIRWTLVAESGGGGGEAPAASFTVVAEEPVLSERRAALLHRVSAAPRSVRRVALAAFDVESGRLASAAAALLAAPPEERTPLGDRLRRHALAGLGAGTCPSVLEVGRTEPPRAPR